MNYLVEVRKLRKNYFLKEAAWCARKESNPEPPEPKSGALSS